MTIVFLQICCLLILSVKLVECCFFLSMKLVFVELPLCWFLFVKFVPCWFFSSWKLCINFFSSWNWFFSWNFQCVVFVPGTYCVLIFCETSCIWIFSYRENYTLGFIHVKLILFMELVATWFSFIESRADFWADFGKFLHWLFLLVKMILLIELVARWFFFRGALFVLIFGREIFLHVDFSLREICTLIFSLVKLILFLELVVYWFFVFGTCLCWFFFVKLVACQYFLRETYTMVFLLMRLILFIELVACWFFCSWNFFHADFSSWYLLYFLLGKVLRWFLSWLNFLCSWKLS